jgi:hypothetical protein
MTASLPFQGGYCRLAALKKNYCCSKREHCVCNHTAAENKREIHEIPFTYYKGYVTIFFAHILMKSFD